jgi:lysophospholipase L1-like esterase
MLGRTTILALGAVSIGLTACGAGSGTDGAESLLGVAPLPTVSGVGALPDTVPPDREAVVMIPAPIKADGTPAELLGVTTEGNRVLVIGDSIMASTSSRYGGQMCDELVPLGWKVAVEAEPSRFIDFGNLVLNEVLDENAAPENDWNAAVVFLGSNYGGDELRYEAELREILDRLAPRPTLLFTVTEYRQNYSEVNEVVRKLGEEYDNVTIVDWEAIARTPGVLSGDRLHPTETGREVLAQAVAGALGPVAIGEGECLKSTFRNDSAVNRNAGGGSSLGGSGPRTTTTTVLPTTPTTTTPSGGGGGGSGGVTTTLPGSGGATTVPVTTAAPVTTSAPTTAAPATTVPGPTTTKAP